MIAVGLALVDLRTIRSFEELPSLLYALMIWVALRRSTITISSTSPGMQSFLSLFCGLKEPAKSAELTQAASVIRSEHTRTPGVSDFYSI